MFPQAQRLDRTTFTHVFKHGRRVHMPGLLLISMPAPTQKVAVVVGKRVAKSAVARNLIKRRLYAALHDMKMESGHIIVVAKPPSRSYSYAQLYTEVATALKRIVGVSANSR